MVEPPVIGFTGVVWQARPTEQLARDLSTGPGAAPMADAGAAWGRLAASFGAAILEYDQIIGTIREAWRSEGSEDVLRRITQLREWLTEAATAAGENAGKTAGQVVAYEVAKLAMPHVAEIAALRALKEGIEQAGASMGAPLVGAVAEVEDKQDAAKADAARVMQSYESAATPLADPWEQRHPPTIATSTALDAEQARAQASVPRPASAGFVPPLGTFTNLGAAPRLQQTAYRGRTVAQSAAAEEVQVLPNQAAATASGETAARLGGSPMAMAPASGGAIGGDETRTIRAAAAGTPGSGLEIEAGVDAAPAVLGAAESAGRTEATP